MVTIDGPEKRNLAKVQIVEILIGGDDGYYEGEGNAMPVEELCGLISQFNDDDLRDVINDLAVDPGSPLEFADDNNQSIWLTNQSDAISFYASNRR